MSAITKSADLVYTIRFLTLLTTPFEETNAFKLGLIDEKGKKIRKPKTTEEKSAYNMFHRLVFNIKKLIAKAPGGSSKIASYASALFLIKEKAEISDEAIEKILQEMDADAMHDLGESAQWFCTVNGMISPGEYRLKSDDKMLNLTCEEMAKKNDKITVGRECYPCGSLLGMDIYEAIHKSTGQKIYITAGEIIR